jgi:hypothetical protein
MRRDEMAVLSPRQQLMSQLDDLSDEQIAAILRYMETLQSDSLPPDYDPDKDPVLTGELRFSGPPDLSVRAKDILRAGLGKSNENESE